MSDKIDTQWLIDRMKDMCGYQWLADFPGVMTCVLDPGHERDHSGSDTYPPVGEFLRWYKVIVTRMTDEQLLERLEGVAHHEKVQENIIRAEIFKRMAK